MDASVDVFRDIPIPMRDGVILRADIYLPADRTISRPALVTRTPYDKSGELTARSDYGRLVTLGFAVVVQDKRGRHKSDGEFTLLRDDGAGVHQDGYDTVEWISAQEWCNGAVGAFGLSYLGFTTMAAAIAAPPSLRAAVSMQPSSDEFTDRTFLDGVLSLLDNVNWATSELLASSLIDRMPAGERSGVQVDLDRHRSRGDDRFAQLPLMEWPFLRHLPTIWTGQLAHRDDADYFAENRVDQHAAEHIAVPIEHVGGWFDPFARNTVRHYELAARFSRAQDRQRLVMGPWRHGGLAQSSNAGVEFPDAAIDSNALIAQWMGTWVTPERPDGDPLSGPAALLYVLGANRWRAEPEWPIPGTTPTPLFFGADGSLDFDPTPGGERSYSYDPHHPYAAPGITEGMRDHTELHDQDNLLTYTSATLTEEVEITGWPRVVLYAATSSTDVDWLVEMHVVDADGISRLFNEGIARARYRNGRDRPEPVEPGAITEYSVALRPISIVLRPGECLKVLVTGGKFPVFERNPQAFVDLNWATDDDLVTARNTIYSGGERASHIELPVVPASRAGEWVANPWPMTSMPAATPVEERSTENLS